MGLIYCRQEPAKRPFYIEKIGVNIYSSQELCYVIVNNPLLVLEDFIDEALFAFMRDELDMGLFALKLERAAKDGDDYDEMLFMILSEVNYYTASEIQKFRQVVASYRKMNQVEFLKLRADYIFEHNQFGKAITEYKRLLEGQYQNMPDDIFIGKVWNNLAAAYARIFQMNKACNAFEKSYFYNKDKETLKKMYYLTIFSPELELKERFQSIITGDVKKECDEELLAVREKAVQSEKMKELNELFLKDPVKRIIGAENIVKKWKQEYRAMI